jgi:hypothetical protein
LFPQDQLFQKQDHESQQYKIERTRVMIFYGLEYYRLWIGNRKKFKSTEYTMFLCMTGSMFDSHQL